MARDPVIERRLLNWARSRQGGLSGGLGYASVDLEAEGGQRGYREATIPVDACEADITDQAVRALAPTLRHVVERLYLHNDSMQLLASRERITERAMLGRLWKAHAELRTWFAERERKADEERARVEALSRMAGKR
jgi:hypothetical protein